MAKHGDLAVTLVGVDLPFDRVHVGDGGEIEIFAPDEGRQFLEEFFAGEKIAGDRARLDIGGAFPVLPHALVITQRGGERDGDGRRARIGPQTQIGAKHITFIGVFAHDFDDAFGHPHEEIDILQRIGEAYAVAVEENDQINVGGIIQLIGAALAHAEKNPA